MFFFFNDTATTEIYTLSLHDALPISKEDLVGNTLLFLFNLLNWALRLSIAFVVYITLLVSGENLKIGIIQSQFRSEEHTSELQSRQYLVCRLLLEKKKNKNNKH